MEYLTNSFSCLWAKKSNGPEPYWLPLHLHLEDTVAVADHLWCDWVPIGTKKVVAEACSASDEDAKKLFIFIAACHDIGKATPVFQSKTSNFIETETDRLIEDRIQSSGLPMEKKDYFSQGSRSPHALAGYNILKRNKVSESISMIISAHHGKPADNADVEQTIGAYEENYYISASRSEPWIKVQNEFLEFAMRKAKISDLNELPIPDIPGQVLLSALLIMADWIASNETLFPYISLDDTGDSINLKHRANSAWKKLNFPVPWMPDNSYLQNDFFQKRFNDEKHHFDPNPLQLKTMEIATKIESPGIFLIESTMGSGKTEAALLAAEIFAAKTNRSGIYFALPTQATSNSMFSRVLEWLDQLDYWRHTIKLSHGKAQFNETVEQLKQMSGGSGIYEDDDSTAHLSVLHEWFEGQKKTLLADFVVGTIDQILLTALKQKHVMLRHLGLSNKVVIIDECHAYDTYMSEFLMKTITWLAAYQVPIIILSATLPIQKRNELIRAYQEGRGYGKSDSWNNSRNYPLITYTDQTSINQNPIQLSSNELVVTIIRITDSEIEEQLEKHSKSGGVIGIILNTVSRAQILSQRLTSIYGEEVVDLIHSRFTSTDRLEKEKKLITELGRASKTRPKFKIIVGTQVLEQSLDIDFDLMFSDLCPMDLLLQRIGRLHRHNRNRPRTLRNPNCFVISPNDGKFEAGSSAIYWDYLLFRTDYFLPQAISLPSSIADLVQNVYDETIPLVPEPKDFGTAYGKWKDHHLQSISRAKTYQIPPLNRTPRKTIKHWLSTDLSTSEHIGRAAVRDGDESVEVLLIFKDEKSIYRTMPWTKQTIELSSGSIPSFEESIILAKQSVYLPLSLCYPNVINKTIKELENSNREISSFQAASMLRGELFLILDSQFKTVLNGYELYYDKKLGLLHKRR